MKYKTFYVLFAILIIVNTLFLTLIIHWSFGAMVGLIGIIFLTVADLRDERQEVRK